MSSPSVRFFSHISFGMFISYYVIHFVLLCYLPSFMQLTLIVLPALPLQVIAQPLPVFVLILFDYFLNAPIPVTCPYVTAASLSLIIPLPFKIKECLPSRGEVTGSYQKIENKVKYANASSCQLLYWSSLSMACELDTFNFSQRWLKYLSNLI